MKGKTSIKAIGGGGDRVFLGVFSVSKYIIVLSERNKTLFTELKMLYPLSCSVQSKFQEYRGFYGSREL